MDNTKLYSYIGLAKKAGKTVVGIDGIVNAMKCHKGLLVIMAADVSDNSRKMIMDKCSYYNAQLEVFGDKARLGHCIGGGDTAAIAIADKNLKRLITQYLGVI